MNPNEVLTDIKKSFNNARKEIINLKPQFLFHPGSRIGDIKTELDDKIENCFSDIALKYNLFVVSEENKMIKFNISYGESDGVIILDPLDGTVNFFQGLTCGMNVAFGEKEGGNFRLKNISGIFVANYMDQTQYSWTKEKGPKIYVPRNSRGIINIKSSIPLLFEIPDEESYIEKIEGYSTLDNPVLNQEILLKSFRNTFEEKGYRYQRRAIDCTGLRMLEVSRGNLIAYGDFRRATKLWDTAPSVKYLIEKGIPVLNRDFNEVNENTLLISQLSRRLHFHKENLWELIVINDLKWLEPLKRNYNELHSKLQNLDDFYSSGKYGKIELNEENKNMNFDFEIEYKKFINKVNSNKVLSLEGKRMMIDKIRTIKNETKKTIPDRYKIKRNYYWLKENAPHSLVDDINKIYRESVS